MKKITDKKIKVLNNSIHADAYITMTLFKREIHLYIINKTDHIIRNKN